MGFLFRNFIIACLAVSAFAADSEYYLDPDYTGGTRDGNSATPWTNLNSGVWTTLNSALSNGNVTVYCSALKANGTTQQSAAAFYECKRNNNTTTNRLTIDGHAKYNADVATPSWQNNPNPITTAWTNAKVFKLTGNGASSLGWTRFSGNSKVTISSVDYTCTESHISAATNQPGTGSHWQNFWTTNSSPPTAIPETWTSGATASCYVKQNYITLRGFEITGASARVSFMGDGMIAEWLNVHDITTSGPAVGILYTTYPDAVTAKIIANPATNTIIRNSRVDTVVGEAIYIGSINPDASHQQQSDWGNQHAGITITNVVIRNAGTGGGEGDGIDCKNGIRDLLIQDVSVTGGTDTQGGIIVPQTYSNINQNALIERCSVIGVTNGVNTRYAIYVASSTLTNGTYKGYNGVTIRNTVIADCNVGISAGSAGILSNIFIFNNTIYRCVSEGIQANASDGTVQVLNNIVLECSSTASATTTNWQVDFTSHMGANLVSSNNAFNRKWESGVNGPCNNCVTNVSTADFVSAANNDFRLATSTAPEVGAALILTAYFTDDRDRMIRGDPWDIGAFETNVTQQIGGSSGGDGGGGRRGQKGGGRGGGFVR